MSESWASVRSFTNGSSKVTYCVTLGKWVIKGPASGGNNTLQESVDGFAWTSRATTIPSPAQTIVGIAGTDTGSTSSHIVVITSGTNKIWSMDNTGAWTDVTPALTGTFSLINYLPGTGFIVVGVRLGSPVAWTSVDGITWAGPNTITVSTPLNIRIATTGFFITYGGSGTVLNYSPDGIAWTQRALGTLRFTDIAEVPPFTKMVGYSQDAGAPFTVRINSTAMDGTSPTVVTTLNGDSGAGGLGSIYGWRYDTHSGNLVIVGQMYSMYSSDGGATWTQFIMDPSNLTWNDMSDFIGGRSVLVYNNRTGMIIGSDLDPFSSFSVNPALNAPSGMTVTPDGGIGYDDNFSGSNTIPPVDEYTVTREDYPTGTNKTFVGEVFNIDPSSYTVNDPTGQAGSKKKYTTRGVDLTNQVTTPLTQLVVGADITYTMVGGVALGGSATIVLIGDPSGLYTLVAGKTHDTIYQRNAGSQTSFNVAIPNPFAEIGYIDGAE